MLFLLMVLVSMTLLMLFYIVLSYYQQKNQYTGRLKNYFNMKQLLMDNRRKQFTGIYALFPVVGRQVGGLFIFKSYKKKIQEKLIKAHIPLKGEEFITICVSSSGTMLVLFSIISNSLLPGIIMALAGWYLPVFIINGRMKKRTKMLNDQLGDAITLVSNSLKAGYSFLQAIDTISTEMSGSIADEFLQVKKEINLGLTTEKALENIVKRVDSDDLELVVIAIQIQRQVGGNLAEILDNISETIRERIRIKGEVRTLTAQGKMSGLIIALIPLVVGVMLFVINPTYIMLLFTSTVGLVMLGISVVMQLLGVYFINSIIKIEV